jgi:hypothetical protein
MKADHVRGEIENSRPTKRVVGQVAEAGHDPLPRYSGQPGSFINDPDEAGPARKLHSHRPRASAAEMKSCPRPESVHHPSLSTTRVCAHAPEDPSLPRLPRAGGARCASPSTTGSAGGRATTGLSAPGAPRPMLDHVHLLGWGSAPDCGPRRRHNVRPRGLSADHVIQVDGNPEREGGPLQAMCPVCSAKRSNRGG